MFRGSIARLLGRGSTGRSRPVAVGVDAPDGGYASVEALIATIVLSVAMAFALSAYLKARAIGGLALETRQARALTAWALTRPLGEAGVTAGTTPRFRWRITLVVSGDLGVVPLCRRSVDLVSLRAPFRQFGAASFQPCPKKTDA